MAENEIIQANANKVHGVTCVLFILYFPLTMVCHIIVFNILNHFVFFSVFPYVHTVVQNIENKLFFIELIHPQLWLYHLARAICFI